MRNQPGTGPIVLVTSGDLIFHPRHYHLLARGLHEQGLDVVVVGQPDAHGHHDPLVPTQVLPVRRGRLGRMISGPAALIHVLRLRPSLIQVNSLDLLPWGVVARAISGCPVLYDSKEDYAAYMLLKQWLPRSLRVPLSKLVGIVEPWLAGHLDGVLVADPATGRRFDGRVRNLQLVHNFPWRSLVDEAAPGDVQYDVIYHGTLPTYHVENFIATARLLQARDIDVRWCLAAREYSPPEQLWLERRLEEAGLRDAFTLHYNLPFSEIPKLLSVSRIGFIPLPDELKFRHNLPRKLFELMAASRPSVVSDLPPTRRLLGNSGTCILARPDDPAAYADALEQLLSDEPLAEEMGRRGRDLILDTMNAEHELPPYVALCEHLSRSGRPADPAA